MKIIEIIKYVLEIKLKGTSLIYNQLSKYYDLIYSHKDYKKEAQKIKSLIREFQKSDGNSLLDVACGTGQHISFFKNDFHCMGIDTSDQMLKIARKRNPEVKFEKNNMIDMNLNKEFDIITCLFSSIGCVRTYENLQKTWKNFYFHLKKGGISIVEPWFFLPMHKQSNYFCPDENIQIARIALSRLEDNVALLDFHYLVSEKGKKVKYFEDHTEVGVFDAEVTLNIIKDAGFEQHQVSWKDIYDTEQTFYVGVKK